MGAGLYYTYYVVHKRLTVVRGAGALKAAFDDSEVIFMVTYQVLPTTASARSAAVVAAKATSITFRLGNALSDIRVGELKESVGAALDVDEARFSLVAASPEVNSPENETSIRFKVMPVSSSRALAGSGPTLSPMQIGQKLVEMHKNGTLALGNYEVQEVSYSQPNPQKSKSKKGRAGAALLLSGNKTSTVGNSSNSSNSSVNKSL